MYVLSVQYSCAVVSVFLFGGKANVVLLTLFYSTLLALTHRGTDGQRNNYTCFAWAGRTCPRFAWAGGTFFSSCAVVSVFGSGGKQVLVVHTAMYLEYHIVVVLCWFFWFWREIVFGVTYKLIVQSYVLSVQCSCAVVSVFLLWRES